MTSYRAYIECTCNECVLIDVFNFLDAVFHTECRTKVGPNWIPTFRFHLLQFGGSSPQNNVSRLESSLSQEKYFLSFGPDDLDRTQIVLTVAIGDDTELDIFTYRYFFLIVNKLLRKQDRAYLDCPDTYYHKVGSHFFLQTLSQTPVELRPRGIGEKGKKLPQDFSLSTEWLPVIYLRSRSSELYKALANPLFKNIEELKMALQTHRENAGRLYFAQSSRQREKITQEPTQEQYASTLVTSPW